MNYKELMAEASRMPDSGSLEKAIAICHKAINLAIQQPSAYYKQALLYRRLGEPDHAISRFEQVISRMFDFSQEAVSWCKQQFPLPDRTIVWQGSVECIRKSGKYSSVEIC